MNKSDAKHQELIKQLTSDLNNGHERLLSITGLMLLWFTVCFLLTAFIMHWLDPFRENFITQILEHPLFMGETIIGFIGISLLATCVFFSSIPGLIYRFQWVAIGALMIWFGIIFSGLHEPVLPVSMSGKRHLCFIEMMIYGIPLTGFMTFLIYRRYSIKPFNSALLIAFTSMLIPAYLMQYACMYTAQHNLLYHLLPAVIIALLIAPIVNIILLKRLK